MRVLPAKSVAIVSLSLSVICICTHALGQSVDISAVPDYGGAGALTGLISGVNPATHKVAAHIYVEGSGWWTKSTGTSINPDGTFSINIGTDGNDELASVYSVSVLPVAASSPTFEGAGSLNLGPSNVTSDWLQRYGRNLSFAGRNWGVKESPSRVGPGGNRFSSEEDDVWVDEDGLHLTIHQNGTRWYSTEVVLTETLGYGTYAFQTSSQVEDLNVNAVFGGFTWDVFGDDQRIPAWPSREIDFEDSRWGNAADPTTSQTVIQPYFVPGNLDRYTLPDLASDPALTRSFKWSPDQIEWITALGYHSANSIPAANIIDQRTYLDNGADHLVPEPGRANFRFNLWLIENSSAPVGNQPVEVVIKDFVFIPLLAGDYNGSGIVDQNDFLVWKSAYGTSAVRFSGADGNGDGRISAADFTVWRDHFGSSLEGELGAAVSPGLIPVPEPACHWIGVLGGSILPLLFRTLPHAMQSSSDGMER